MSRLYSKKELAAALGCSVSKIEKMMKAGEIPYRKIGTLVRFTESTVGNLTGATPSLPTVSIRNTETEVIENTMVYGSVRECP